MFPKKSSNKATYYLYAIHVRKKDNNKARCGFIKASNSKKALDPILPSEHLQSHSSSKTVCKASCVSKLTTIIINVNKLREF